jgi:hypothetical protein
VDIFGALVLFIVMYLVIPVAICAAALVVFGGAERFLPAGMRNRAVAGRESRSDHH